jgi:predicted MFS family arabinose efflux permease
LSVARQGAVVALLGSAQTISWGSSYYLPAILAVPIARDLGMPVGAVFGAFSVALLVAAAVGPAAGRWIDRAGGRGLLVASNFVFAAGLAALAGTQGAAGVFAAWAVIGLGMGIGLYEAGFATLVGIYGRGARGPITGITLIAGFASTVAWPLTAFLDAEVGWRAACLVWAGVHLGLGLPLNALLPRGRARGEAARPVSEAAPRSKGERRTLAALGFVFAAGWFTSTAMAAHLPRLLQDLGAGPAAAVAAAALVGPAQVAGRVLEFGVLARFHPLLSARLATLANPVGTVVLLALGAPAAAAFALLHGAGNGILTIAKGTLPLALFGPEGYGRDQGLIAVPTRLAQAAAPLAFALVVGTAGPAAALVVTAGLMLAAFVVLMRLALPR